jgi:hypothetical protein
MTHKNTRSLKTLSAQKRRFDAYNDQKRKVNEILFGNLFCAHGRSVLVILIAVN